MWTVSLNLTVWPGYEGMEGSHCIRPWNRWVALIKTISGYFNDTEILEGLMSLIFNH